MKILKNKITIFILLFLYGCSSIPTNTSNSCSIFDERYLWYKYTKKVEQKWGTPIYIQLAIIKMESDFDWLAKPARQKIFKVIPYKRPSSSFGYSQAVKGTWEQYKIETGNKTRRVQVGSRKIEVGSRKVGMGTRKIRVG